MVTLNVVLVVTLYINECCTGSCFHPVYRCILYTVVVITLYVVWMFQRRVTSVSCKNVAVYFHDKSTKAQLVWTLFTPF